MATHFTTKGFEEDYDLLMGLAQILALLNLYDIGTGCTCRAYLDTETSRASSTLQTSSTSQTSSTERQTTPKKKGKANKKKKLEDMCTSDAAVLNILQTVFLMLEPYMNKKHIEVGWSIQEEKYVLVYKGKILDLKVVDSDIDITEDNIDSDLKTNIDSI